MSADISLPNFIKFEILDPPPSMDDFIEISDKNYDIAYSVRADSPNKTAKLILVTQSKQKIMLLFNADAKIGIKGFTLYLNANDLLYLDYICNKSEDGKHVWQSQMHSGKFHLKSCSKCGHYVSNMSL